MSWESTCALLYPPFINGIRISFVFGFVFFLLRFFYGGEGEEGGIIVCSSIYTFDIPSTIK